MKRILVVSFLIISFDCFSQKNDSILYFPLRSGDIEMHGVVLKMLKRNNVSEDSARTYILNVTTNKLKDNFWNCIAPERDSHYKALRDSLELSQCSPFQIKKMEDRKGSEKITIISNDNDINKYYGHFMNKSSLNNLALLIKESNSKFVICLNKFEIKNRNMFSSETSFILHVEIYDENAIKVFGNKLIWEHSLSANTSYSLLPYWIRNAMDDFYSQLKDFIH